MWGSSRTSQTGIVDRTREGLAAEARDAAQPTSHAADEKTGNHNRVARGKQREKNKENGDKKEVMSDGQD